MFLNFLKTLYPYSTNPNITMNDITLNDLERFPGFDGVANSKKPYQAVSKIERAIKNR